MMCSKSFLFSLAALAAPALTLAQQDPVTNATSYITAPDLTPVSVHWNYTSPNASVIDGHLLVSTLTEPQGLYILNATTGSPIWINNLSGSNAVPYNFHRDTYQGDPVLIYWQGSSNGNFGTGRNYVLNESYGIIANFTSAVEPGSDFHEFRLTANDTALVTRYPYVSGKDISGIGAGGYSNATILDGCFDEVNVTQGDTIFSWCASTGGVNFAESYAEPSESPTSNDTAWDWFHPNTVSKDQLGNYLLSGRHVQSLYYIASNGTILWRLGGKASNFTGNGTSFAWQHDALFLGEGNYTASDISARNAGNSTRQIGLFDNEATAWASNGTRSIGKIIELNMTSMTASLLHSFNNPSTLTLLSQGGGSFQSIDASAPELANAKSIQGGNSSTGRVVMGYGQLPYIAEYESSGTAVAVMQLGNAATTQGYRAAKRYWTGRPTTAPSVVFVNSTVAVSWNGATELHAWRLVQLGAANAALTFERTSFETRYNLSSALANINALVANATKMQLVALDSAGSELGRTVAFYLNGTTTGIGLVNGTASASPPPLMYGHNAGMACAGALFVALGISTAIVTLL